MINRRGHRRIPLEHMIGISFDGSANILCQCRDLSLTGIFLYAPHPPRPSTSCTLTIRKNRAKRQFLFRLAGQVIRRDGRGLAISFTEMTFSTYSLLQTLLLYHSHDPAALGEEFIRPCPFTVQEQAA